MERLASTAISASLRLPLVNATTTPPRTPIKSAARAGGLASADFKSGRNIWSSHNSASPSDLGVANYGGAFTVDDRGVTGGRASLPHDAQSRPCSCALQC